MLFFSIDQEYLNLYWWIWRLIFWCRARVIWHCQAGVVVRSSSNDAQAASYCLSLVPIVDVIPLIIGATCRLNRQALTANFAYSGEIDVPLVVSTLATIALVSAEDDGGASVNDTHCINTRD